MGGVQLNFIDYKPEHAIAIIKQGANEPNLVLSNFVVEQAQVKAEETGPSWTVEHDGRIVGCGGITISYDGFGEAWAVCVHDTKRFPSIHRGIRDKLFEMIIENDLIRCQITLRTDFPVGVEYAEWLGFKYEATLAKYFPDHTDAYMYVIIGE